MQKSDLEDAIKEVLAELQPMIVGHGGQVLFERLEGKKLFVTLHGACTTCPMSIYTIKLGVEEQLKKRLPDAGIEVVPQ